MRNSVVLVDDWDMTIRDKIFYYTQKFGTVSISIEFLCGNK